MPTAKTATAIAHPNIAFIKYWGNTDHDLRIPVNGSFSMNLAGFETRTTVTFDAANSRDTLTLNEREMSGEAVKRVAMFLNRVRKLAGLTVRATVITENNFPTGAGIASSASAYAALAVAATHAIGLQLSEVDLSRLARTGSGSASRSVPGGFVEWAGVTSDEGSYAFTIAPPEHWELVDCVAIVSTGHKATGSSQGHPLAETSPLQDARVADANRRIDICRDAILNRDFDTFADIVELDNNMMHAVMMTSNPRLIYWQPATLAIMQAVQNWRADGVSACYTIDAGPNVHVLCLRKDAEKVASMLEEITGVLEVRTATPGGAAHLVTE